MSKPSLSIIESRCVGCGRCLKACPFQALSLSAGKARIDEDRCTLCGACVAACHKYQAIDFQEERPGPGRTGCGPVWVFGECDQHGAPSPVVLELLGLARELALQLSVRVEAVMIGHRLARAAETAIAHGANRVFTVDHPSLRHYLDQPYGAILARLIREQKPEIVLGGATALGRALLPRVAVLTRTGLTADCTQLAIDPETGLLRQTRPAFGGNILATISCARARPQMATVRPGMIRVQPPGPKGTGEVIHITPHPEELNSQLRHLEFHPNRRNQTGLREAEVIVTAGYGVGGPAGVEQAAALATALGGQLGASRSVVDAGWVEYARQIGQTGTTVQPRLYLACGVSGAIQHLVGMQNSQHIVAINKDPEAPIFDYADIALVGDVNQILEELLQSLQSGSRPGR